MYTKIRKTLAELRWAGRGWRGSTDSIWRARLGKLALNEGCFFEKD